MSFDLFVYLGEVTSENLGKWQDCLIGSGIHCSIPKDLDLDNATKNNPIRCELHPPLSEKNTFIDDCNFFIELLPVDKYTVQELVDNTNNSVLIKKLLNMKYVISIFSNDENEGVAMKLKCFVSAALVNACDGVLLDPQEFGAVYGAKVYEVARYYTQPTNQSKSKRISPNSTPKHSEKESNVVVKYTFVAVFIFLLLKVVSSL